MIRQLLEGMPPSGSLEPALRALDRIGKPPQVLPILRHLGAADPSPAVRYQAERLLKVVRPSPSGVDFGSPPDLGRVRDALGNASPELRTLAVKVLRTFDPEYAFPVLEEAIRSEKDLWVLSSMVSLVGLKGAAAPGRATSLASEMLAHASPRVAANALLALFALDPERGVAEARGRLDDPDPRMRTSAVMATFTADPNLAWAHVLLMLGSGKIWMRTSGSYLAAKLNHEDSERALLEALSREEDPALVLRTLAWFGSSGSERCVETLELIARLGEQRYRPAAAKSLAAVQARVRSRVQPVRGPTPRILESGFHLTNAIPVVTEDAEGNPTVKDTGTQAAVLPPRSAPGPSETLAPETISGPEEDPGGPSTPDGPTLESGALRALEPDEDAIDPSISVSQSTDSFLKSMVDDELEGPVPAPPEDEASESSAAASRTTTTTGLAVAAVGSDRSETLAKVGILFLLVVVGALGTRALYGAWTRPPPRPTRPPTPTQQASLTPVAVRDGKLDLNKQPSVGRAGRWAGAVAEAGPLSLVLRTDEGVKIPFRFSSQLEAPRVGTRVRLEGTVVKKRRSGITLAPGAKLARVEEGG